MVFIHKVLFFFWLRLLITTMRRVRLGFCCCLFCVCPIVGEWESAHRDRGRGVRVGHAVGRVQTSARRGRREPLGTDPGDD